MQVSSTVLELTVLFQPTAVLVHMLSAIWARDQYIVGAASAGKMAEWSKALRLGRSPRGRGFESHSCQYCA